MKPPRFPDSLPLPSAWALALLLLLPAVLSADSGVPRDEAMLPEEADEGPAGQGGALEPAAEPAPKPCAGQECPATAADWIFYRYGGDCAGMDWRFLRAAAKAESGLDPRKREGKRAGLFQLDPESCSQNLGPFASFLNCSDLSDPEANTAAALNRLHRYLAGRRDLGGRGGFPAILDACPDNAPAENAALALVGIKLGPGVLRHVLKGPACKDDAVKKAISSFYEGLPKASPRRGLEKYEGVKKLAGGLGLAGPLYRQGAVKTTLCPAEAGKRLFSREELDKVLADGSFNDKPLLDPEFSAQFAAASRLGASWEKAVSARLARMDPAWEERGDPGGLTAGGAWGEARGGAAGGAEPLAPGSQLPQGLRTKADAPPRPDLPKDLPTLADVPVEVKPVGVKLTGPKVQKHFNFKGEKADAEAWTAVYDDGATFVIMTPKGPKPAMYYHTAAQAADAARYLPKDSRARVKSIVINRGVNPDDAYWAKEYKRPDFHSYMTAGEKGIITIYPNNKPLPGKDSMRSALMHETGHIWSYQKWGTDKAKNGWVDWKKAMDSDKTWVSEYAKSSIAEDIAETFKLYGSTFGGPNFKGHEAATPKRFAMLAKELK